MVTWEKVELGKSADIFRGGSPRPIQAYLTQSRNGVNWIKIGDVAQNAKYISTTEEKITPEGAVYSRAVSKGDFILSNSMSFGRPYILRIDGCIHDGWLTIQNYQNSFDTDFFYYVMGSEETLKQYISMAAGSSVQNLNKEKVSRVIVVKPPLLEQRRIAEALSDTDALLAAMEKLIVKKRTIKQGAMQELLTGKRRLPEFEGEWVEKTVDDCLDEIIGGGTPARSNAAFWNGGIPWVTVKDFATFNSRSTQEYISDIGLCNSATHLISKGAPIIATRMGLGQIVVYDIDVAINQDLKALVLNDSIITNYFVFWFESQKANFESMGTGSTVKGIRLEQLKEFPILLPPTIAEQVAIAEILSDMDAEIDALTAKLNKLRNIKQGMMSELLTGRIRLVGSEPAKTAADIYQEQEAEPIRHIAEDTNPKGHNQQFDDAVMIAGIVDALYSDKYPLGRKKVQKCLYLLRRYQGESTAAFKKKAAGPYADEVRYKGGEPIAKNANYIATINEKQGTTFARGKNIGKALGYIQSWGKEDDIKWVADKLKFKKVDELELLATVDMTACDLTEAGTPVSVQSIKYLIATNAEWKAKLKKQTFSDANIARALRELNTLLQGGS